MHWYLFDVPKDCNDKHWVVNASEGEYRDLYTKESLFRVYAINGNGKKGKIRAYVIRLKQCFEVLLKSTSGDTIVCWENTTGLLLNRIVTAMRLHRNIVIMTWLSPEPKSNFYMKLIRSAIENPNCRNITKIPGAVKTWAHFLGVRDDSINFTFIPETYEPTILFDEPDWNSKKEPFCLLM